MQRIRRPVTWYAMTPMIDIVFQLIAFFVFALSYGPKLSKQVTPPETTVGNEAAKMVVLEIDHAGRLIIDGNPEEATAQRIDQLLGEDSGPDRIAIRADGDVNYEAVSRLLQECRKREVVEVSLQMRAQP